MGAPGRGPRMGSDPQRWQPSKSAELPWLEEAASKYQTSCGQVLGGGVSAMAPRRSCGAI